jgi:hypothetical protein
MQNNWLQDSRDEKDQWNYPILIKNDVNYIFLKHL